MVELWSPEKFQRDYITSDPSETYGSSGKVAGSEGHEFNDVLEKVKVAAEANAVSTPERCYRPVERARERRKLRLEGSQRSSVLSAWEQERVYLRCDHCNNKLTDSDWSKFKSEVCQTTTQCVRPPQCEDPIQALPQTIGFRYLQSKWGTS